MAQGVEHLPSKPGCSIPSTIRIRRPLSKTRTLTPCIYTAVGEIYLLEVSILHEN
jgi:hypothetical protein